VIHSFSPFAPGLEHRHRNRSTPAAFCLQPQNDRAASPTAPSLDCVLPAAVGFRCESRVGRRSGAVMRPSRALPTHFPAARRSCPLLSRAFGRGDRLLCTAPPHAHPCAPCDLMRTRHQQAARSETRCSSQRTQQTRPPPRTPPARTQPWPSPLPPNPRPPMGRAKHLLPRRLLPRRLLPRLPRPRAAPTRCGEAAAGVGSRVHR
jgi:hypothetical protein